MSARTSIARPARAALPTATLTTALAIATAACGDEPDPCAGVERACLAIRVTSSTVRTLDELQLDVLYGDRHGGATVARGAPFSLPATTAIELDVDVDVSIPVEVVAAGRRGGDALGTGLATATLTPGEHATVELRLAPPAPCDDGRLYCGGEGVAGAPSTLYRCNAGAVPTARGRCAFGCLVRTGDDLCDGGPDRCVAGGYCGGDKVDGDPQTLYQCENGVGVDPVECDGRCVVAAPGFEDFCE